MFLGNPPLYKVKNIKTREIPKDFIRKRTDTNYLIMQETKNETKNRKMKLFTRKVLKAFSLHVKYQLQH